jgi:hypothetical protein
LKSQEDIGIKPSILGRRKRVLFIAPWFGGEGYLWKPAVRASTSQPGISIYTIPIKHIIHWV